MLWSTEHRLSRGVTGSGTVSAADGFYTAGSTVQLAPAAGSGYQFAGWSGSATGLANPLIVVMDAPKSITASFTAAPTGVRIESISGVTFTVSGAGCPAGAYTAPATLTWINGGSCNLTVQPPPAAGQDVRSIFSGWADGPVSSSRSLAASPGAVYTIVMAVEYRLTRNVSGSGAVSGSDGFYASGSTVPLTATAGTGHQFTGWTGSASGTANPLNVVMDYPKVITGNFGPTASLVRIDSNIAVQFTVSGAGCPAGTYTAPTNVTWNTGTNCDIGIPSPQGGPDTRQAFSRWSDGSTANARTLTASPGAVFTIVLAAEHRLARAVSGPGTVNGSDGFYTAGTVLQLTASGQSGYQFAGWSGAADGLANPLIVVMDAPKTITGHFGPGPAVVRIEANTPLQFNVSGAGCPAGTYTTPVSLTWTNGTGCNVTASPQGTSDSRWVFSHWSDGSASNPRTIVAAPGAVYSMVVTAEHRLARAISGPGTVNGSDGFYAAGTVLQLTASAQSGYQFAGWSGAANGLANPLTVVMDAPKTITGNFGPGAASVRIEANTSLQFNVSGAGCPAGTHTTPVNLTWTNGAGCNVTVSPQGTSDSRWVFSHWSDGSASNPRTIAAAPGAVYSLVVTAEHRLTRTVSGPGTVSAADGFYAAASVVPLTATPADGYQFVGWSGTGGGADNPVAIRMDGPITMIANFTPVPAGGAVETFEPLVGAGPGGAFTAKFSHGGGANQLYLGYILFLPTPNVVNYVATGSCLVEYNRISHGMRLIDDAGTGWLGPESGVVIGPNAGVLTNRQCTLNVAGASASATGNIMSVTAPVTFKGAVSPIMATFLQALDVTGKWTGMTQFGNWVPSNSTPRPGPSILGVAYSTSAGSYAVYSITAAHTSGASALSMIHLLLATGVTAGSPCQAVYFPGANTLNLINDTGSALVAPGTGVVPGTPGSIANSRCAINTGLASQSVSGNNQTVTIPLNLQPATFGGVKSVYVNAFDAYGQLTHWVQASTLTVQ